MTEDEAYMRRALSLAEKGRGWVSPNPVAGAVVVKDGRIIGEGYHRRFGGPHAEREALAACTESPEGAVMYVTLEPCCHWGKQPPCTEAILESRIKRVAVGAGDPNPLVNGKGIQILRRNGIEVTEHVCEEACMEMNRPFFHLVRTGRPFVVMKYAMTLDGKIAAFTGESKWITGEEARQKVHRDRGRYAAVMAGVGTVLTDDPMLNCRAEGGRDPFRIICDSRLRTPLSSKLAATAGEIPVMLATASRDRARRERYEKAGFQVLESPGEDGRVDLKRLMEELGRRGIDSVLLEGGAALSWSALRSGIVNRVQAYVSPKILGGETAKGPVGGQGSPSLAEAYRLKDLRVRQLGGDFLIEGEVDADVYRNC